MSFLGAIGRSIGGLPGMGAVTKGVSKVPGVKTVSKTIPGGLPGMNQQPKPQLGGAMGPSIMAKQQGLQNTSVPQGKMPATTSFNSQPGGMMPPMQGNVPPPWMQGGNRPMPPWMQGGMNRGGVQNPNQSIPIQPPQNQGNSGVMNPAIFKGGGMNGSGLNGGGFEGQLMGPQRKPIGGNIGFAGGYQNSGMPQRQMQNFAAPQYQAGNPNRNMPQ